MKINKRKDFIYVLSHAFGIGFGKCDIFIGELTRDELSE